ncbi:hypothetical protein, partial [Falsibacillus albus]
YEPMNPINLSVWKAGGAENQLQTVILKLKLEEFFLMKIRNMMLNGAEGASIKPLGPREISLVRLFFYLHFFCYRDKLHQ